MSNLKNIAIKYTLDRLDKIDTHYKTTSQKSSQWKKLATKIHADLRTKSLTYYRDGLKDVRNAIRDSGRKHPSIDLARKVGWCEYIKPVKRKPRYHKGNSIAYAINVLPSYTDDITTIKNMPSGTMKLGQSELMKKIDNDSKISANEKDIAIDVVDNLLLDHPVIGFLTLSKAKQREFKKASKKSLDKLGKYEKVYNFTTVLELAKSRLDGESYTEIAWALAVLTGRRSVEIMRWAEFEKIDSGSVMFSGQAKKREGVIADSFPIPVLVDSDDIIAAMTRFRSLAPVKIFRTGSVSIDGVHHKSQQLSKRELNKAINQRTNGVLNERAQRLMNDGSEMFKNTRSIYARYCSDNIRNTEARWEGNEDQFLKNILGHSQTDQIKHYRQVMLKYEAQGDWLKVAEPEEEKQEEEKVQAKRDTRAGKEIKEIGILFDKLIAAGEKYIAVPVGKNVRRVKLESTAKQMGVRDWHYNCLRVWAYENSHEKITQTAIVGNKGNTASAGTGSVDVKVNRYTFKAWASIAGDLLKSYNNASKRNDK
jgi:hypothetical protein